MVQPVFAYTHRRLGPWLWVGLALAGWGGLVLLSHWPTPGAILWTNRLFGWVLLLSYLSLWAAWLVARELERQAWFRCVAIHLALGVAWLGLELPAAMKLLNWGVLLNRLIARGTVNHQYQTAFVLDPELEFRRPPYIRWSGPAVTDLENQWLVRPRTFCRLTFTYDGRGYRNSTEMDHAGVALLGDSFVDGWYVSDEETTASVLQAELGKPIANLGVAGYGTIQELVVLKREVPRLHPAVVVWFFFEGNDFYDDFRYERALLSFTAGADTNSGLGKPVAQAHPWRQRSLAGSVLRLLRAWSDPLVPNRMPHFGYLTLPPANRRSIAFANYAAIPWSPWLAERWRRTQTTFHEGVRFCRQQGIHLILCYVPDKFRVYRPYVEFPADSPCRQWTNWSLPAKFEEFCREAQVPYLDLTKPFQEAVERGEMPYAPTDSHWGPEGHKLVARLLRDKLHP